MSEFIRFPPKNHVVLETLETVKAFDRIVAPLEELAEHIECLEKEGPPIATLLQQLGLSTEDLSALQLVAFEWNDSISLNSM